MHRPAPYQYLVAIGSNQPRGRSMGPRRIVAKALESVADITVLARAPIIETAPLGPSLRRYANSAALIETPLPPPALLALLKALERAAGRRPGRRWGNRPLDLDIILWSGGAWRSKGLTIPHKEWTRRDFVLVPLLAIAPDWRAPGMHLTTRNYRAKLQNPNPVIATPALSRGKQSSVSAPHPGLSRRSVPRNDS